MIDENIKEAVEAWKRYGIMPGSCIELLLRGEYAEAYRHAHPLILPYWDDHIEYIEELPDKYRDVDNWKGDMDLIGKRHRDLMIEINLLKKSDKGEIEDA